MLSGLAGLIAILTSAGLMALASLIRTTCCAWAMPNIHIKKRHPPGTLDHPIVCLRIFILDLQIFVDMDGSEE